MYATNEDGTTFVMTAADKFQRVAENKLEETCLATPAFCNGRIYVRTTEHLLCITGDNEIEAPGAAP